MFYIPHDHPDGTAERHCRMATATLNGAGSLIRKLAKWLQPILRLDCRAGRASTLSHAPVAKHGGRNRIPINRDH